MLTKNKLSNIHYEFKILSKGWIRNAIKLISNATNDNAFTCGGKNVPDYLRDIMSVLAVSPQSKILYKIDHLRYDQNNIISKKAILEFKRLFNGIFTLQFNKSMYVTFNLKRKTFNIKKDAIISCHKLRTKQRDDCMDYNLDETNEYKSIQISIEMKSPTIECDESNDAQFIVYITQNEKPSNYSITKSSTAAFVTVYMDYFQLKSGDALTLLHYGVEDDLFPLRKIHRHAQP